MLHRGASIAPLLNPQGAKPLDGIDVRGACSAVYDAACKSQVLHLQSKGHMSHAQIVMPPSASSSSSSSSALQHRSTGTSVVGSSNALGTQLICLPVFAFQVSLETPATEMDIEFVLVDTAGQRHFMVVSTSATPPRRMSNTSAEPLHHLRINCPKGVWSELVVDVVEAWQVAALNTLRENQQQNQKAGNKPTNNLQSLSINNNNNNNKAHQQVSSKAAATAHLSPAATTTMPTVRAVEKCTVQIHGACRLRRVTAVARQQFQQPQHSSAILSSSSSAAAIIVCGAAADGSSPSRTLLEQHQRRAVLPPSLQFPPGVHFDQVMWQEALVSAAAPLVPPPPAGGVASTKPKSATAKRAPSLGAAATPGGHHQQHLQQSPMPQQQQIKSTVAGRGGIANAKPKARASSATLVTNANNDIESVGVVERVGDVDKQHQYGSNKTLIMLKNGKKLRPNTAAMNMAATSAHDLTKQWVEHSGAPQSTIAAAKKLFARSEQLGLHQGNKRTMLDRSKKPRAASESDREDPETNNDKEQQQPLETHELGAEASNSSRPPRYQQQQQQRAGSSTPTHNNIVSAGSLRREAALPRSSNSQTPQHQHQHQHNAMSVSKMQYNQQQLTVAEDRVCDDVAVIPPSSSLPPAPTQRASSASSSIQRRSSTTTSVANNNHSSSRRIVSTTTTTTMIVVGDADAPTEMLLQQPREQREDEEIVDGDDDENSDGMPSSRLAVHEKLHAEAVQRASVMQQQQQQEEDNKECRPASRQRHIEHAATATSARQQRRQQQQAAAAAVSTKHQHAKPLDTAELEAAEFWAPSVAAGISKNQHQNLEIAPTTAASPQRPLSSEEDHRSVSPTFVGGCSSSASKRRRRDEELLRLQLEQKALEANSTTSQDRHDDGVPPPSTTAAVQLHFHQQKREGSISPIEEEVNIHMLSVPPALQRTSSSSSSWASPPSAFVVTSPITSEEKHLSNTDVRLQQQHQTQKSSALSSPLEPTPVSAAPPNEGENSSTAMMDLSPATNDDAVTEMMQEFSRVMSSRPASQAMTATTTMMMMSGSAAAAASIGGGGGPSTARSRDLAGVSEVLSVERRLSLSVEGFEITQPQHHQHGSRPVSSWSVASRPKSMTSSSLVNQHQQQQERERASVPRSSQKKPSSSSSVAVDTHGRSLSLSQPVLLPLGEFPSFPLPPAKTAGQEAQLAWVSSCVEIKLCVGSALIPAAADSSAAASSASQPRNRRYQVQKAAPVFSTNFDQGAFLPVQFNDRYGGHHRAGQVGTSTSDAVTVSKQQRQLHGRSHSSFMNISADTSSSSSDDEKISSSQHKLRVENHDGDDEEEDFLSIGRGGDRRTRVAATGSAARPQSSGGVAAATRGAPQQVAEASTATTKPQREDVPAHLQWDDVLKMFFDPITNQFVFLEKK